MPLSGINGSISGANIPAIPSGRRGAHRTNLHDGPHCMAGGFVCLAKGIPIDGIGAHKIKGHRSKFQDDRIDFAFNLGLYIM